MRAGGKRSAVVPVAGRVVLWAAVLVLLVRGVADLVPRPEPPAPTGTRATAASGSVDEETRAFAVGFARAFLTFTPGRPEEHARALRPYLAASLGEHAGLELPTHGRPHAVVAATTARTLALSRERALVTVAVELAGATPRVRYLTVPLARGDDGALAVFDYPSFSAPPPRLEEVEEPETDPLDPRELAAIEDVLARFFPVYLAGRSEELAYFLPPGERLNALAAPYRLLALESVTPVGKPAAGRLGVLATVRVRDEETKAVYLLTYRVRLERRGRWYVAALNTA